MRDLAVLVPDVEVLVGLEPEELAPSLLKVLQRREAERPYKFHLTNMLSELGPSHTELPYPNERREGVQVAVAEAFAWLQSQGLVISSIDGNGSHGWCILSRRARKIASEEEFRAFRVSRLLQKEILHASIANTVWQAFMRGEYDVAVFQAMKAVEVRVRDASGLPASLLGVKLMRSAFDTKAGPLTDTRDEAGEVEAVALLFAGAIGLYKNPHSHRDVGMNDAAQALEIVLLANNRTPRITLPKSAMM